MSNPICNFDEWWARVGRSIDPDTSDVPWEDKRRALAEAAFDAAIAQSGNYVANDDTRPTTVIFANGRAVRIANTDPPSLRISPPNPSRDSGLPVNVEQPNNQPPVEAKRIWGEGR